VRGEAVQDLFEIVDGAQIELHEVTVLPRDPVALGDFGHLARDLGDHVKVTARGADPDDRADRVPEGPRIHLSTVGEGAIVLEPTHPVADRGRGKPDPATELGDPDAGIDLELLKDSPVDAIKWFEALRGPIPSFRWCFDLNSYAWPFRQP
jgi:hypothetical protein